MTLPTLNDLLRWKDYLLTPKPNASAAKSEAFAIVQSKALSPQFFASLGAYGSKGSLEKEFSDLLFYISMKGRVMGRHEDYTKFGEDLLRLIHELKVVSGSDEATNILKMEFPKNFEEIK